MLCSNIYTTSTSLHALKTVPLSVLHFSTKIDSLGPFELSCPMSNAVKPNLFKIYTRYPISSFLSYKIDVFSITSLSYP